MFAGAELEQSPIPCELAGQMVMPETPGAILVRPDVEWPACFRIKRDPPFEAVDTELIGQFVRSLGQKLVASGEPFFGQLLEMCSQDVVAWSVQHRAIDDTLLPEILRVMQKWSSQTYEGARISVSIGVDPVPIPSRISTTHFSDLIQQDYAKVLSNGLDTLLVLSPSGHVVEHLALTERATGRARKLDSYTPDRYRPLAEWTTGSRVAFALNRHGEILVFKRQQLQFAFRRGRWCHFPHDAVVNRMGGSAQQKNVMRAVYASCLDISFARTGACIAVSTGKSAAEMSDYVSRDDLLDKSATDKSLLLKHLLGKPFPSIPRRLREEIGALDGAVLLDGTGVVIAAGAIVSVPGGSEGGGRRAAAKALSRLGLAVKVSADGAITAFTDRGTKKNPEIAFELCA
jgi:succinate dehydrogenase flavin-adding protein (antitoxin of CptAB toxin-antitoxin module)